MGALGGWTAPSPDGRYLADIDGTRDRHDILNILHLHTGKKIRSLKLKVHCMTVPSWSPDGRWIAYAGNALGAIKGHRMDTELFLISPDGRRHRQLPDQVGEKPFGFVWAADSQSVFYNLLATNRHEIWQLNINGKQNPIKHKPFHKDAQLLGTYPTYEFSPNGKQIAYISHEGLYVADVDGVNLRRVVDIEGFMHFFQVDWSPNGQNLVFSALKKKNDYGLYIFSFASKKVRPLITSQKTLPGWPPHWVEDSLAVHPSNKMAVTWGAIKNLTKR